MTAVSLIMSYRVALLGGRPTYLIGRLARCVYMVHCNVPCIFAVYKKPWECYRLPHRQHILAV